MSLWKWKDVSEDEAYRVEQTAEKNKKLGNYSPGAVLSNFLILDIACREGNPSYSFLVGFQNSGEPVVAMCFPFFSFS